MAVWSGLFRVSGSKYTNLHIAVTAWHSAQKWDTQEVIHGAVFTEMQKSAILTTLLLVAKVVVGLESVIVILSPRKTKNLLFQGGTSSIAWKCPSLSLDIILLNSAMI